jgi:cytochrome c5
MTPNMENGKKVYGKYCIACHMTGVAGAAKLDDKARWTESAEKGLQTLVKHALHGYQGKHGVLPEKGTCAECKAQDILDAVSYMLNKAGVTAK